MYTGIRIKDVKREKECFLILNIKATLDYTYRLYINYLNKMQGQNSQGGICVLVLRVGKLTIYKDLFSVSPFCCKTNNKGIKNFQMIAVMCTLVYTDMLMTERDHWKPWQRGASLIAFSQQHNILPWGLRAKECITKTECSKPHMSNQTPRNITHNPLNKYMHLIP